MAGFKVKETLRVLIPGRSLDIQVVAPEVLIVGVTILVLFRNVRFDTTRFGKLVILLIDRAFL